MRALLAGLFVFAMLLIVVGAIGSHLPNHDRPWWGLSVIFLTLTASIASALFIFNESGYRPSAPWKTREERIRELEEKGPLVSGSFKAVRTIQVKEYEDEGLHYFIELDNGSVLYLSGQYLYDDEGNHERTFPNTEFTIRRHKTAGFVVDISCKGNILAVDCEAPPFDSKDHKLGLIPEDGQIIQNRSYDELKKQRLKDPAS